MAIIGSGQANKQRALNLFQQAANLEQEREDQNRMIKQAERANTGSAIASGAALGASIGGAAGGIGAIPGAAIGAVGGLVFGSLF